MIDDADRIRSIGIRDWACVLAAFAALTLSVGFANAEGVPAGFQGPAYGSHAFIR
ncbi:MAG TPA: hypothetical protein VI320_25000 [Terracidiphilus sp.]